MPARILIVDDEAVIRDTLVEYLQQERFVVSSTASGEDALALAREHAFDVVLCDLHLPGMDGLETLEGLLKISPETQVILITAYATVDTAVEAFQAGAQDYLIKPVLLREVLAKVRRLLAFKAQRLEAQALRRELHRDPGMVVGSSPLMQQAVAIARKAAPTRATVLILGESGTGKELMAHAVHSDGPFLALNCAAIPPEQIEAHLFGQHDNPGVFLAAGHGTVFLDEIGETPLATQGKLLRALEQKEIFPVGAKAPVTFEARIVAATNKDLAAEVQAERFREDLYYRLSVLTIVLPPLRERREDIPELVDTLVAKHARVMGRRVNGVSHAAMKVLRSAPWKGNIRELENVLQRAVILGEGSRIELADLPADLRQRPDEPEVEELGPASEQFEKRHIERILRLCPDKRDAARRLGIGLSSLYRKIEQYEITSQP